MWAAAARWLGIQDGEWGRTGWMFVYLFLVVGAFVTGRICRDTLFLSRYDITYLPYMYAWVALIVSALSILYSQFADRFRRDRLVQVVGVMLLGGLVAARLLLNVTGEWFLPVLYVFIEVLGAMVTIQFWTFANDIFTTRQAKRLFGLVGAGGVAATIAAGFAVGGLSAWLGTANLLWLSAGLLAAGLVVASGVASRCRRELSLAVAGGQALPRISPIADMGRVFSSRHLKLIAWITILTFIVVTVVDFQFKVIARYTFLNREAALAGFFGLFYGSAGILCFTIQFLLTGRLLQRFGVIVSLLLLPLALAFGTGLLLLLPGLAAAALLKGADQALRYSINDASTQVLYLPVAGRIRGRAKAFITGVLKPLSQGLCGLGLAAVGGWIGHRVDWLGMGSLVALGVLMLLVLRLKRGYIQSLVNTLRQRRLHFGETTMGISDSQAVEALEQTLADDDERNVLHALEMIPYVQRHDWSDELGRLLDHPSTDVRLQALKLLVRERPGAHLDRILGLLRDSDESLRAEAVGLYCAALKDKAMAAIEPLLRDESVAVQAAAVVGLIRYGGLDGIITAAEVLKALLTSTEAERRRAGAWALGRVGVKTLYRSLLPLLDDPAPAVRVAAVRAAGELRSPELVLSLIHRLADPHTRRQAVTALAGYGSGLLNTLRTVLDNPREDPAIRLVVPQVLARIEDPQSMDILANVLNTDQVPLRARALDAALKLHARRPDLRRDRAMLRRVLHRELKQAYQLAAIRADLVRLDADLLREALAERQRAGLDRIFKLLRLIHPRRHLEAIQRNLDHPLATNRANAVELLEQVLDAETRRSLLPMLETGDPASLAATGMELFPLLRRDATGWLHQLLLDDHPWTVATTLQLIRDRADSAFEDEVRLLLDHASPLVRESAAFCLERLTTPERFAEALTGLSTDPHPLVQAAVRWLRPAPAGGT
jgi:ATP/ADP translocase/HEAT repeat protein